MKEGSLKWLKASAIMKWIKNTASSRRSEQTCPNNVFPSLNDIISMRLFSHWMLHCSWWLFCHTAGYKKLKDFKKSTDGSETSVQYNSCQIYQGKSLALTVLLSTHRNSDSFYTAWLVVVQSEKWAGTPAVVRTIQTENMTWSSTVKLNVTDAHL